jgi:L-ascorbate metabolism protein UlaG (beta-lactamase superfamily)
LELAWYGHACFRIREAGVAIVTDPYSKAIGLTLPRMRADVVTVSHEHEGHSGARGLRGHLQLLQGPGEYEVGGVFITGVPTFHDDNDGKRWGRNVAFLFDFGGLTVCHLGDLGHVLAQEQVEMLNGANVLLIPAGGGSTLSVSAAVEVVGQIEPNIVIPMHYATPGLTRDLAPVSRFLKAMGASQPAVQDMLRVSVSTLPQDQQVVLLALRGGPGDDEEQGQRAG